MSKSIVTETATRNRVSEISRFEAFLSSNAVSVRVLAGVVAIRKTAAIGFSVALLALAFIAPPAQAASAVAYDEVTGAWAYDYQVRDVNDAKRLALNSCRRHGGRQCQIIVSCARGGYGRVYRYQRPGQRRLALGGSCGWNSVGKANDRAKLACNQHLPSGMRCGVGSGWYDAVADNHVPGQCKNAHPSRDPCYRP